MSHQDKRNPLDCCVALRGGSNIDMVKKQLRLTVSQTEH